MSYYFATCYFLAFCMCISFQCYLPSYNLSIFNLQNEEGEWVGKMTLDYPTEEPLEIYTSRKVVDKKCSDQILIVYKKNESEIEKERLQVLAKRTEPPVLDTCPCTCSKKSDVNEEIVPNTHLETEPNMAVPVKSKIPEGYHKLHNISSYVKVNAESKYWHEAKYACESEGAHLLILDSIEEADSVSYWVFLTGNIKKYFWVGFHDFYEEGKHVSLFNQSVPTLYNKWWPEYDGRDDYDCVMIYFSCEDHGLLDWKCGDSYPYICEIEV